MQGDTTLPGLPQDWARLAHLACQAGGHCPAEGVNHAKVVLHAFPSTSQLYSRFSIPGHQTLQRWVAHILDPVSEVPSAHGRLQGVRCFTRMKVTLAKVALHAYHAQ